MILVMSPQMKKGVMKDKEELNESVGAAHVENVALKIFLYADGEDKNGSYHNHKSANHNNL